MNNQLWIALLGSSVLTALINVLYLLVLQRINRRKGVADALRLLLQSQIKYLGKKYIMTGAICADDLQEIIEMHRVYHDELYGNGYLDELMARVRSLPITT